MHPSLWFLLGGFVSAALCLFARRPRQTVEPPREVPTPPPKRPRPRRIEVSETRPLEELSLSLADELANLVTGVEGQSQLLCEALGEPQLVREHAEQLWENVRRLRFFGEKLQSSAQITPLEMQPTDVSSLLNALVLEIEDYAPVTRQVTLNTAPSLPLAMANADRLRSATLFLIESVFDLEPDASTLVLSAQASDGNSEDEDDDELTVEIDIEAILEDGDEIRVKPPSDVVFSFNAAKNILSAQNARVGLQHAPGLNAIATITVAAANDPVVAVERTFGGAPRHQFGGVLVMEGNPTIRHMLARELRRTNRNVIVCADGVAATSLFDATPERFELLILEKESRRVPGETVARKALERNEDLKIIMVTPAPGQRIAAELATHPNLRTIHKPFGLMELREAIGSAISPEPIGDDAAPDTDPETV